MGQCGLISSHHKPCQIWCVRVFYHVLLKHGYENAEWNEKKKKNIDDVTLQYSIHRSVQYGTTVGRPAAIGYKRSTFCNNFFFLLVFFPNFTFNRFIYFFFLCFFFRTLHPFQKILDIGLTVKFGQNKAPLHHFGCKFSKLPVHDMYPREGNNQVCSVYTYMWDHRNEKKNGCF